LLINWGKGEKNMKKLSLAVLFSLVIMLISICAPMVMATGPAQGPGSVDTTTLYEGTIGWGPKDADPAVAYDTGSGELIFNTYDCLIALGQPVTNIFNTWDVDEQYWQFMPSLSLNVPTRHEILQDFVNVTDLDMADPTGAYLQTSPTPSTTEEYFICGFVDNNQTTGSGLSQCDVVYIAVCDAVTHEILTCQTWHNKFNPTVAGITVTLHLHRFYYDFNLRTEAIGGGPIKFFSSPDGAWVGNFSIDDVKYSLERVLVIDAPSSGVAWMEYAYTLDQHGSGLWDTGVAQDVIYLSHLIDDAFEIVSTDPPVFRIYMGIDFPDVAFKQIIAQTWSSIMDMEYSAAHGEFNGDLFTLNATGWPEWWNLWHGVDTGNYYETNWVYVGTGPYHVVSVDDVSKLVILERNPDYWNGWPAPGRKSYLDRIDIEYIDLWSTRMAAFIACQVDVCAVPRAYMMDLLNSADIQHMTTKYPAIVTIKNIYPGLALDATHYTMLLKSTTTYCGDKQLPTGIPLNFFNFTNIRYAFSDAFNRTDYIASAYFGEASLREDPLISGLVPDYYSKKTDISQFTFGIDYGKVKNYLQNTFMNATGGTEGTVKSVWDWGFTFTMTYNTGNDQRKIACNMIRDFFTNMSSDSDREGKPAFSITVTEVDWPTYLTSAYGRLMPVWAIGWLSDYTDADNWMGAYMDSYVCFAPWQRYMDINGWNTLGPVTGLTKDQLIALAIKTPDGPLRATLYHDLEAIYLADCPSLPVAEPLGRRFCKYWVKGWYYDGLYPSTYFYNIYKEDACWCDVTGLTMGVPDGVDNMRDIGWITSHFGARAPSPTLSPQYDPMWAPGVYGAGGCDVYGDRVINMRDIGLACAHFLHTHQP
jgi:peptide/nickel transport system substrate-binding protein